MSKPSSHFPWAANYGVYDITVNGTTHSVPNRAEPMIGDMTQDFTRFGIGYNIPVPVQYVNYQLYSTSAWIAHIDERIFVDSVYITSIPMTVSQVQDQFGGVWAFIGTKAKPYGVGYYWKKIY